ncbi:hypothetical protein [Dietzia maris]|uniref:ATP-grasp domain-containing protein n=1 Tax=Dietzia maris TaxID=37915 RepID=A0ABT8H4U5_9ACTN|nr:hypothetical protein [Dietzia maris]MDN4507485.1 hypothetical protein [Dietzia maris]
MAERESVSAWPLKVVSYLGGRSSGQEEMMQYNYAILDPLSDQALGLKKLLKSCTQPVEVHAITSAEWTWLERAVVRMIYRRTIKLEEAIERDFLVVPTGYRSTVDLIENVPDVANRLSLSDRMLEVADKESMLDRADNLGYKTPRRLCLEELKAGKYSGPIFYKELTEQGGGRRGTASSLMDLPDAGRGLLLEEVIGSAGTYGVAFFARDGRITSIAGHFESVSTPSQGGSAVVIESYSDERLKEFTAALVADLEYSGWGLAEFKWSERVGEFVLMEINGKLWASSEFSFRANPHLFFESFGLQLNQQSSKPGAAVYLHRVRDSGAAAGALSALMRRRALPLAYFPPIVFSLAAFLAKAREGLLGHSTGRCKDDARQ